MGLAEILAKKRFDNSLPKPTVKMYVELFNHSSVELYRDYFWGMRLLIDWLGLPVSTDLEGEIPRIFKTYEIQELAALLEVTQYEVYVEALKLIATEIRKAE